MNRLASCLACLSLVLIVASVWLLLTPNPPIPRPWFLAGFALAYAPLSESFSKWVDRWNQKHAVAS